ncbi:translation initiation factor IF-2-like [Alexandromys fortis]|uniref:translation initiation factor IF-2-like n=1 Tax=Alexandromys fortis TaxID=100897 RepID=UPI0021531F9A|nr:translation initiation factor IF-2-like [Microtus fortis]
MKEESYQTKVHLGSIANSGLTLGPGDGSPLSGPGRPLLEPAPWPSRRSPAVPPAESPARRNSSRLQKSPGGTEARVANNSKRSGPGTQVRPTPGSRKARGLEGGRAAKREAQGARPRGRGRDGRKRGRARAPSHGRAGGGGAGGAGAGRRGEGGKRAPWSPAESGEGVDAEGAGPGEAGTRSRAGKAGARRWRERARSPPLFPTLPSTSDRPELRSGSARRSPEPPLAFFPPPPPAASPSIPSRRAPPSGPWMVLLQIL